tara:strand:+ start:49 stop:606 length:558 start_codon:yes stop_codon:yes gene_type:complete
MLEYALRYAALGWAVFPCRPNDKRPATLHGCLDATTDPDQIRAWWTEIPDLNIGLACGEISNITALDIDPRSNGHEFLAAAIDDNEPIDGVWESQTGGGGIHYLFTYGDEANVDLAPGVEIKSDGKYIILPPSIHPNGNSYEWELSSSPIEDYENNETDAALAAGDGADEESIFGPLRQPATNAA